jgi:hypothetical protein
MQNQLLQNVSQTQKERLFHIDFRLFFLGLVNRNDLVTRFGIKEAAATRDITLYKEIAPKNLEYDTKAKTYIQREGFSPLFSYSSHQALAALLHGYGDDFVSSSHTFDAAEAPTQLHLPACDILAFVTRAINFKQTISIGYRSLSSGLTQREIVPHSLIDNGLRWHVRAFDRLRRQFSDFVINRIEQPCLVENLTVSDIETKAADQQWNQFVELQLVPHPSLRYPETIAHEYGFENGELTLSVRVAVAGYVLRRWNVDCSENHALEGPEYHLWLKNRQALSSIDNLILAPGYSATGKEASLE